MARAWRLQILVLAGIATFLAAVVAVGWARETNSWQKVGRWDDVARSKPLYNEDLQVFILRGSAGPIALSARGPWQAEKVEFCVTSKLFETSKSGSKFDRYGRYYGGPAPRGMTRFPTRIDDGLVYIQHQHPIEGPPRDGSTPLEPAGPLCIPT